MEIKLNKNRKQRDEKRGRKRGGKKLMRERKINILLALAKRKNCVGFCLDPNLR